MSPVWQEKIINFCQQAYNENKHEARTNMSVENWQNSPASLLYVLIIEKRFSRQNGGLQLLINAQDDIVALGGYYRSDFNDNIYLMGVRTWVLKQFRHELLVAEYLLPYQLSEIQKKLGHFAVISFNESTRSFAKLIGRSNKNPDAKLKFFFDKKYPDIYKDMVLWKSPVKIKNVKQWILVKKLSDSSFDWNSLNWVEN